MDTRILLVSALAFTVCIAALPRGTFGDIVALVDDRGALTVRYYVVNMTGEVQTWGSGWVWDNNCSSQFAWAPGSIQENEISGNLSCSYGRFAWHERALIGGDYVLLEVSIKSLSDATLEDVAWVLHVPVESFKGGRLTAVMIDGTAQSITLREEYVPGQASLGPGGTRAGWVIPFGVDTGLVTTVFSDSSSSGAYLDVTDDREYGGATYSVKHILYPGTERLYLKAGEAFTFYVYLQPYNRAEELERARQRVLDVFFLLSRQFKASEIARLISEGRLDEVVEGLRRQQLTLMFAYAAATIAAIALAIAVVLWRLRIRKGA